MQSSKKDAGLVFFSWSFTVNCFNYCCLHFILEIRHCATGLNHLFYLRSFLRDEAGFFTMIIWSYACGFSLLLYSALTTYNYDWPISSSERVFTTDVLQNRADVFLVRSKIVAPPRSLWVNFAFSEIQCTSVVTVSWTCINWDHCVNSVRRTVLHKQMSAMQMRIGEI